MRAIDSALCLGRALDHSVTLQWFRNSELNCHFGNLFAFSSAVLTVVDVSASSRLGRMRVSATPHFYRKLGYQVISQVQIEALLQSQDLIKRTFAARSTYVSTCSRFFEDSSPPYESFVLAPRLAECVEVKRRFVRNAVGVHVRRTDNHRSMQAASVADFVAVMEREIDLDSGIHFFVATDDPNVLDHLVGRFGKAILYHPKRSYSRNDPIGIEDALIDLHLLASCRRLIGSYWSSFTDTATQIGNMETRIIKGNMISTP